MTIKRFAALCVAAIWAGGVVAADSADAPRWDAVTTGGDEPWVVLHAPPTMVPLAVELWLGVAPWGCATPLLAIRNTGETSIVTGGAYEQGEGFALGRLSVDGRAGAMMGFKVSPLPGGELAAGSVASGTATRTQTNLQTLESLAAGEQARLEFVDIETGMAMGEVTFALTGLRTALRVGRQMCLAAAGAKVS